MNASVTGEQIGVAYLHLLREIVAVGVAVEEPCEECSGDEEAAKACEECGGCGRQATPQGALERIQKAAEACPGYEMAARIELLGEPGETQ